MNIDKVAKAIEEDAGVYLPELKQSLSEMQSETIGRTYTAEQLLLREARKQTSLSQKSFAQLIKTPTATLQDWEQGRFSPPGGVLCLLKIIIKHPDLVDELAV